MKPPDKDKLLEMIEKVLERQRRKLAKKREEELAALEEGDTI